MPCIPILHPFPLHGFYAYPITNANDNLPPAIPCAKAFNFVISEMKLGSWLSTLTFSRTMTASPPHSNIWSTSSWAGGTGKSPSRRERKPVMDEEGCSSGTGIRVRRAKTSAVSTMEKWTETLGSASSYMGRKNTSPCKFGP